MCGNSASPPARAAGQDVELARLERARALLPDVVGRYDDALREPDAARRIWRRAVADARAGRLDDRPLYWARLQLRRMLGERCADAVEWRSRGFDIAFPAGEPRVLLVGFDPFRLHRDLGQSNPSGVMALALHGARVAGANVRSAILPVRFRDFDAGLVEELLGPVFTGASGPLTLAMTISMGGEHFDLERFAGRRRAPTQRDNQDVRAAAPNAPLPDQPEGPEFLEFSLPAAAMTRVRGRWRVRDNRNVETAQGGVLRAVNLAALAGATAVAGSGGAFLSNEVTYRSLLLQRRLGAAFPLGHLHTPAIAGHDGAVLAAMVAQARDILTAALTATASRQTP